MNTDDDDWVLWLLVIFGSVALMTVVALLVSLPFAFVGWIILSVVGIFVDFAATYSEYVATGIGIALIISWRTR